MTCDEIVNELRSLKNPANVAGMARYGANPEYAMGISILVLRKLAKRIGKNHSLAGQL